MVVFLIGMMGSGKSTIGMELAKIMSYYFIDMDQYIEKTVGMQITEIFQVKGEEHFRMLESQALDELKQNENTVIATGGGTPAYFRNMDTMLTFGRVVYLKMDMEDLFERLVKKHEERPLIMNLSRTELRKRLSVLMSNRAPIYEQAHSIYIPGQNLEQDAQNIKQLVYSFLN